MRRLFLLVGVVPLLTGCFGLPFGEGSLTSTTETVYCIEKGNGKEECRDQAGNRVTPPDEGDAVTTLRAAIPAIEAYYADHGTYAGMTVRKLRATYDSGISPDVEIMQTTQNAYCVERTAGGETYSYRGPRRGLSPGGC